MVLRVGGKPGIQREGQNGVTVFASVGQIEISEVLSKVRESCNTRVDDGGGYSRLAQGFLEESSNTPIDAYGVMWM